MAYGYQRDVSPVAWLAGNGLQVGEYQLTLSVLVDFPGGGQCVVGVLPGLVGVAGDRVGAG